MRGGDFDPFDMLIEFLICKTNICIVQLNDGGKKIIIHKPDEMIKCICLTKSLKLNSAYSRFLFQFTRDKKKNQNKC